MKCKIIVRDLSGIGGQVFFFNEWIQQKKLLQWMFVCLCVAFSYVFIVFFFVFFLFMLEKIFFIMIFLVF